MTKAEAPRTNSTISWESVAELSACAMRQLCTAQHTPIGSISFIPIYSEATPIRVTLGLSVNCPRIVNAKATNAITGQAANNSVLTGYDFTIRGNRMCQALRLALQHNAYDQRVVAVDLRKQKTRGPQLRCIILLAARCSWTIQHSECNKSLIVKIKANTKGCPQL